ncbi:MAG TPA: hydroxymethylbilane synthase [Alphaproteobacteria bacterium]
MSAARAIAAAASVVIGTRGSPLALAQAGLVRDLLAAAHPGLGVEIRAIRTAGDRFAGRPLATIGGKGLFTREIDAALADGAIDLAVHSVKDLPTDLPHGLDLACVPAREDPRDVLIARDPAVEAIADLPRGAWVGTVSLRRAAQALSRRPDLRIVALRGNVETRLAKIAGGEADATFLALAGLRRLGRADAARVVLAPEEMLPAPGQGALGIECRADDARARALLAPLDDGPSHAAVTAERALLAALEGSCRTPIAALAAIAGDRLNLRAMIAMPDGSARLDEARDGPAAEAAAIGHAAGAALRARAGPEFFAALGQA